MNTEQEELTQDLINEETVNQVVENEDTTEETDDFSNLSYDDALNKVLNRAHNDFDQMILEEQASKSEEEHNQEAGQVDAVAWVNEELEKLGITDLDGWHKEPFPDDFKSNQMSYQRFVVNRMFRLLIGMYGVQTNTDTMPIRYLLVDEGSYDFWKSNMGQVFDWIKTHMYEEVADEEQTADNGLHSQ